jgi:methionyl-tRNA formyltransferase
VYAAGLVRTAFFGTPPIAVPALEALTQTTQVVAVVCQPDRPAGRGLALSAPAVKLAAQRMGLDVHQPVKVKTGDLHTWLAARAVDAVIVLAYGRILPPAALAAPRLGCLNLHASVLPRYRGAAPINWALIRGETETGISLMQMDEGLDTGPVYSVRRIPIGADDDAGTLTERLAELGAVVVREDVARVLDGRLEATPQDDSLATLAPPITKEMTRVEWNAPARDIRAWVRGLSPKPGAVTRLRGKALRVLRVEEDAESSDTRPGTVVTADRRGVRIATGRGSLWILRAQPEGRKPQSAADLVNGRAIAPGDVLGAP